MKGSARASRKQDRSLPILHDVQRSPDEIYDKNGRPIALGDVLKVFHFVGSRNKRHYMYKQVASERVLGSGRTYWFLSHLTQRDFDGYLLAKDGKFYLDYEIVQSIDARFEDRPRVTVPARLSNPNRVSDDGGE